MKRTIPISLLVFLLGVAGLMRFDRITKTNLWQDECRPLNLATGRGDICTWMTYDKVIDPPKVLFAGAPPWWKIWSGHDITIHPPLYHLMLRSWVDAFGESDLSIRGMSAVFCLLGIVLLFDVVRRVHGPWQGLIAAGIMAFAPVQVDYSQEARPYTMLVFLALVLCDLLIVVQRNGISRTRLAGMAIATAALALTHYFSLGAIAAVGIYVLIRFTGKSRRAVLLAMGAGLLFAAVAWGPMVWKSYHQSEEALSGYLVNSNGSILFSILDAPERLLFGEANQINVVIITAIAGLVYVSPLLRLRRNPELLLWWLVAVCSIGIVALADVKRHSELVSVVRYVFLASPGVYVILATSFSPGRIVNGAELPMAILLATIIFGISRWQMGPTPKADANMASVGSLLDEEVGPNDVVVIRGQEEGNNSALIYFVIAHYNGEWKHKVMCLSDPGAAIPPLPGFDHVWVVGPGSNVSRAR